MTNQQIIEEFEGELKNILLQHDKVFMSDCFDLDTCKAVPRLKELITTATRDS